MKITGSLLCFYSLAHRTYRIKRRQCFYHIADTKKAKVHSRQNSQENLSLSLCTHTRKKKKKKEFWIDGTEEESNLLFFTPIKPNPALIFSLQISSASIFSNKFIENINIDDSLGLMEPTGAGLIFSQGLIFSLPCQPE